jgi:flagellar hook-length control protein FliK
MLSDNFSPNTLRPIFSKALSLKLEIIKLDAFIRNYSTGQTLSGKVVQVLPEQKAVVEIQGEKLLLQFPRPVNPGQNIAIKIEQIHPNLVLKLTNFSPSNSSQKIVPGNLAKEVLPSNIQESDKTSIQNRSADSLLRSPVSDKNAEPGVKSSQVALDGKVTVPLSKTDLKQLGIQVGQRAIAEVLRVVGREALQVRLNGNEVTVKYTASQKLQPGESVYIYTKSIPSGKFTLAVEQASSPSSTVRPPLELSVLKNYLPVRQPLIQVIAGLKEAFLEGPLTQLKELNIDPGPLKQLQANLQKIVSRELKAPDAGQLKEMIGRSGFHYEAKVRDFVLEPGLSNKKALLENDLKGQLLRLGRQLEQLPVGVTENTASDKFITKLMSQVNQAVSNIELQQLVHYFSKEEQHPLLLQLPENLLGEEDRFKIYILPDQKEGADPEPDSENRIFNLVFLLNLSALGDLRIETKVFKDEISIHIISSNSGAAQFIQAHVPELEDVFRPEGFSINVTSGHQTEVSMEVPDSLGQLLIDTPLQIVDLKT